MRVLVACEESQTVTIEMRKLGHEAYSCDIQACSGGHPEWHLQCDALELLKMKWDMIIAHPPCTYLSNAGANRMYPKKGEINRERYIKALQAKEFFMKFLNADCSKICVENPMPLSILKLPRPDCIIQPYEFGEPYTKRTYLWLKGLPPLMPVLIENEHIPWVAATSKDGHTYGVARSQKLRSKTFPGIARAMAEQWAGKITE